MREFRTGSRDPGAEAAVRGVRYAEEGACVPWAAMAAIERATRDAADRRAVSALRIERRGQLRRLRARLTRRFVRNR